MNALCSCDKRESASPSQQTEFTFDENLDDSAKTLGEKITDRTSEKKPSGSAFSGGFFSYLGSISHPFIHLFSGCFSTLLPSHSVTYSLPHSHSCLFGVLISMKWRGIHFHFSCKKGTFSQNFGLSSIRENGLPELGISKERNWK